MLDGGQDHRRQRGPYPAVAALRRAFKIIASQAR